MSDQLCFDGLDQPAAVRSKGMTGHQSHAMISDQWLTPPEIIAALGPFDLDPCAAPEPRPWPTAGRHVTPPGNGLAARWDGRVWLNPPYGDKIGIWTGRLARHGHGTALLFARTETTWFIETVWQQAAAALFLHGRLFFCRPDGSRAPNNSGAPSVLVAYGEDDAARLRDSGIAGTYVRWRAETSGAPGGTLFDADGC